MAKQTPNAMALDILIVNGSWDAEAV